MHTFSNTFTGYASAGICNCAANHDIQLGLTQRDNTLSYLAAAAFASSCRKKGNISNACGWMQIYRLIICKLDPSIVRKVKRGEGGKSWDALGISLKFSYFQCAALFKLTPPSSGRARFDTLQGSLRFCCAPSCHAMPRDLQLQLLPLPLHYN